MKLFSTVYKIIYKKCQNLPSAKIRVFAFLIKNVLIFYLPAKLTFIFYFLEETFLSNVSNKVLHMCYNFSVIIFNG